MTVVGIDACRLGWVAVELDDAGRFVAASLSAELAELPDGHAVTGVDIPVGLLEAGWRLADSAAALFVGARRSSVFPVPPRAVWDAPNYEAANTRCRTLTGTGMSRQAWALGDKLREANALHQAGTPLYEVHPEVSFRAMAGTPLVHGKRTWAGQRLREQLLREQGIVLPVDVGSAGVAAVDDVLDAAAAAWSAHRIAVGAACSLPDGTQDGIAIWY